MSAVSQVPKSDLVVLLVEDDHDLAATLKLVLQKEGFTVLVAGTGEEGLAICRSENPDVVVLDYELPDITGQYMCQRLREWSDVYVMMLTARDNEIDKVLTLSLGADDYMTKPFSRHELIARIGTMLRRPHVRTSEIHVEMIAGDVRVNRNARTAYACDQELDLTKVEFEILDKLTENAGNAVTRTTLLKSIWGAEWTGEDHLIDTHVYNLRRKLSAVGMPKDAIATVRGVGLRLSARTPLVQLSNDAADDRPLEQ